MNSVIAGDDKGSAQTALFASGGKLIWTRTAAENRSQTAGFSRFF